MLRRFPIIALGLVSWSVFADILPGFSLDPIAEAEGFLTSIAFDRNGSLHYTTMDGGIWEVEPDGYSSEVARVETAVEGNAALLGMAFAPDGSIVVHYVAPDLTADVISRIDRETGDETILVRFQCSPNGAACPSEHHGGNPAVAADGTIFVGLGDYGLPNIGQRDDLFASKIFRIAPESPAEVYAKGFRNPFDLAWDEKYGRVIATDNGPTGHDEIVFVQPGENHGWPLTMGDLPAVEGMTPPVYTFPGRVAPTGMMIAGGDMGWFREGLLVTSFVDRALYYFPGFDAATIAQPVKILEGETTQLIDVRQNGAGDLFVASTFVIYRLTAPIAGDVDGDQQVTSEDRDALLRELADAYGESTVFAQEGSYRATWGADVDQNGIIDSRDLAELSRKLGSRKRTTMHPDRSDRRRLVGRGDAD